MEKIVELRKNRKLLPTLKKFYKQNPGQFITDWGITYDPRNVERGLPALIPFVLFPKQEEFCRWLIERWKNREPGIADKSRDMGMSWLTIAMACTICLFNDGVAIGFGSRKEEYVDKLGDPKSLLYKARKFISLLPKEFKGIWEEKKHAPHMRIQFPETGSIISGEAGDGIGRGDRASIYIVDEAAFLPRPELVEASLSETTNCRIDISTPRGLNNPFARKRFGGKIKVFSLHWSEDPRKDENWYRKRCEYLDDPVIIAQELDLNYNASVEGVVIPSAWVQSAIDAHIKLKIEPKGIRKVGLDIADQGQDKNAFCGRYGVLIETLDFWSGEGGDIQKTMEKVFTLCDILNYGIVDYDADGIGAGARGDARVINDRRLNNKQKEIKFNPFRGSGSVVDPEGDPFLILNQNKIKEKGRTNADFFANLKAQGWWSLRKRFQLTHRAITENYQCNLDDIIAIPSSLPYKHKLITELSQPTYSQNEAGKIIIDKMPDGSRSPNLADAVMIAFSPSKKFKGFFAGYD